MNNIADSNFRMFTHYIYEFHKGLRSLALHTTASNIRKDVEFFLKRKQIAFYIQQVTPQKINVFFGDNHCVEIVKSFGITSLTQLTDEQDFMLGIMLGYDRTQQCERYLKRIFTCQSQYSQIKEQLTLIV